MTIATGRAADGLTVEALTVAYGATPILHGISFTVAPGEILALVGESGSGKSTAALAVLALLPEHARFSGEVRLANTPLPLRDDAAMGGIRGRDIGFVSQDPMTALDPLMTIGEQVAETIRQHRAMPRRAALTAAAAVLARVGLPPLLVALSRYPHELSGGQRQRVAIAIAIALDPRILIADEPTTALDVTTQALILDLLRGLVAERRMGLILVTHDLGVVAEMADRVAVLHRGEIVEQGPTATVFRTTRHDYTKRLVAAAEPVPPPRHRAPPPTDPAAPVLDVRGVVRDYADPFRWRRPAPFRAVDDVSLTIMRGETVGLVGESGCGKSTLLRTILALDPAQAGVVLLDGEPFRPGLDKARLRALRRRIQGVWQDPFGSFDPHWRIERVVAEPLHLLDERPTATTRRRRVEEMLEAVGLAGADADRLPHQFSGGQLQRIAIARALIVRPELLVLDEAVSALDASMRGHILDLLADLAVRFGLSALFVTHDLHVVRAISDRVLVMRHGRIVEQGQTARIFAEPGHDYTRQLIAATPTIPRGLSRFAG